jgi:hypothetical protein
VGFVGNGQPVGGRSFPPARAKRPSTPSSHLQATRTGEMGGKRLASSPAASLFANAGHDDETDSKLWARR